ncbi:uncharacterized protein BYT42DRAFT_588386 [Radiomyces spectabilis]|uniref:uncharacterized protein n=1 Tax=Radiomyces spectabilis TaxID=64574 RepID=UPI00221EE429|nr:uncharacterized protein BYT42DRAFT_588386 [Radiomyces spectabilis]KAI8365957.1 hypothetical protein BYT42DRAFT_588386 [Radiomyces spectabilis]
MPVYNACVGKRPPRSLLIRWALLATFCFQWTNVQGTHHDHSATPRDPAWLLGVNLDDIPNAPIRPVGSGVCPDAKCDGTDNEKCFENCAAVASASDVYGCPRDRHWALTFDDGPSALTASLLDVLDEYQVKATFCVLGAQVEKFPHLVKRAFLAGHQIASHTYSHPHLMSLTNEEIVYEMKATEKAIEAATGSRPRYMRPPYGEADARVKAIMRALGYKMLLWNVDPTDYKIHREPDAPELIEEVFYDIISGKSPSPNPHDDEGFISLQHGQCLFIFRCYVRSCGVLKD